MGNGRLSAREAEVLRELSEIAADQCVVWARREGLLGTVSEEQFTELTKAFMAGFGLGVQAALRQ